MTGVKKSVIKYRIEVAQKNEPTEKEKAMEKKNDYQQSAFKKYGKVCVLCGFGIHDIVEIAHIDGNNKNHDLKNLVPLCPTCHKMLDVDLIAPDTIKLIRDRPRKANWDKLEKAAQKAAEAGKVSARMHPDDATIWRSGG